MMSLSVQEAVYFLSAFLLTARVLRWIVARVPGWRAGLWVVMGISVLSVAVSYPYTRGYFGNISASLVLFLLWDLFRALRVPGEQGLSRSDQRPWLFAAAGLILYPSSLFILPWHAYAWGFPESEVFWAFSACILAAGIYWYGRRSLWALVLPGALAAYHLRLLESDNLWDYLIDPLLFLWAAGALLLALARKCRKG